MPARLPIQVRAKIADDLGETITRDELDRWVTAAIWFVPRDPELDALMGEIMLRVAEYRHISADIGQNVTSGAKWSLSPPVRPAD